MTEEIPYHKEALSMADLGMIPEGAYRNRKYASEGVSKTKKINRALEDIYMIHRHLEDWWSQLAKMMQKIY